MTRKLLTIAVPTYNRCDELKLLLHTLGEELVGNEQLIELVISDNASTDGTDDAVQQFKKTFPSVRTIRHEINVGMDENFCSCLELATGCYYWMLGDDDLPKKGVIRRIVQLLLDESPDLLYLSSKWIPHISSADDSEPVTTLATKALSREDFAQQVNVWITFISGMVVNMQRLCELNPGLNTRRFTGTSLVHLGWILPLLMTGNRFQIIERHCILATSGNTGGYKLFTVFGSNFPAILSAVCGSTSLVYKAVTRSLVWSYIPKLIWISRFNNLNEFLAENTLHSLKSLKTKPAYWIVIMPIFFLPKYMAIFFLAFSKLYSRFVRFI